AIDAGAQSIEVLLENGGKKRIRVRDDGSGMSRDDAILALERHATSKIRQFDDLTRVRTLGFRGEALPSIASVSRFSLTSFDGLSDSAVEIECDPLTSARSVRPAARDRGTTVVVRELFENVPARRKFLRSAESEFRSIVTVVSSYALPLPSRAFRLAHNGRLVLDLPPAANTFARIVQVLGTDAEEFLSEIDESYDTAHATGYVTRGHRYGSRRNQYFFVNGRLVRDRVLTHAANRAAEAFDFDGHPGIVLFLEIDPTAVDVNVHPAKTEVRFRDSGSMHVVVEHGIRRALGGAEEGKELLHSAIADSALSTQDSALFAPQIYDRPAPQFTPLFQSQPIVQPPLQNSPAAIVEEHQALGDLAGRVIGQYRMSYILIDTPGGLRLIDQHAAHERVLYDRYIERIERHNPMSQQLLTPMLFESGAAESAVLESHSDELRAVGFEIERFSGNAFAIASVPPELVRHDVQSFLHKLIDASLEERSPHVARVREKVCASLACQAAIKVHRALGGEEMAQLTADLLESSNPFACPHGRPVIVDIKHPDIERHFHRR
ncbi:MAG TPA: DNA mismatch repair endonuclease MutL, partial [Thermoanaerobaculia bacterium]